MITPAPNLPAPEQALDEDASGILDTAAILAAAHPLDRAAYEKGRVAVMRSQLIYKFKLTSLDAAHEERLREATPEEIDRHLRRVLVADSLAAVFDD